MNIKERLINGNKSFVLGVQNNEQKKELNTRLIKGQNPYALIITCSDSRVIPEKIFSTTLGELFVIRTAGNVINEGELATIEYAIEHLHISYILVLGHTHCGAIHASIHHEKGRYLSPILSNIEKCIGNECDERKASIINAKKQVEYIKNKFIDYNGVVEAALYDIETNVVEF